MGTSIAAATAASAVEGGRRLVVLDLAEIAEIEAASFGNLGQSQPTFATEPPDLTADGGPLERPPAATR